MPRAVLCDGSMRPAISARHRSSVVRALVPSLSECWCQSFWWISTSPAFLLLIPFAPFPRPSQSVRSLERPLELLLPPPRPRRPLLYGSLLSLGVKRASVDVLLIFCCSFRRCSPPIVCAGCVHHHADDHLRYDLDVAPTFDPFCFNSPCVIAWFATLASSSSLALSASFFFPRPVSRADAHLHNHHPYVGIVRVGRRGVVLFNHTSHPFILPRTSLPCDGSYDDLHDHNVNSAHVCGADHHLRRSDHHLCHHDHHPCAELCSAWVLTCGYWRIRRGKPAYRATLTPHCHQIAAVVATAPPAYSATVPSNPYVATTTASAPVETKTTTTTTTTASKFCTNVGPR